MAGAGQKILLMRLSLLPQGRAGEPGKPGRDGKVGTRNAAACLRAAGREVAHWLCTDCGGKGVAASEGLQHLLAGQSRSCLLRQKHLCTPTEGSGVLPASSSPFELRGAHDAIAKRLNRHQGWCKHQRAWRVVLSFCPLASGRQLLFCLFVFIFMYTMPGMLRGSYQVSRVVISH